MAKLKAGGGKGIYDLNRSLAIDPNLFQAFLTRAAHYGRTGRHSKAILNCNEAIKLVPNSVRAHLCRYVHCQWRGVRGREGRRGGGREGKGRGEGGEREREREGKKKNGKDSKEKRETSMFRERANFIYMSLIEER